MAELIKRSTVIDVLKETGIIQDNDLGHLIVEEIERMPTTTEAEIRAKAFSDFVDKAYKVLGASDRDVYCKEIIEELAEQLKKGKEE